MSNKDNFSIDGLDEIISPRIRLGIMAILIAGKEVDFSFLKDELGATSGNLGSHLKKLEDEGYIIVTKGFFNRKPKTTYEATEKGKKAFLQYIETIEKISKRLK